MSTINNLQDLFKCKDVNIVNVSIKKENLLLPEDNLVFKNVSNFIMKSDEQVHFDKKLKIGSKCTITLENVTFKSINAGKCYCFRSENSDNGRDFSMKLRLPRCVTFNVRNITTNLIESCHLKEFTMKDCKMSEFSSQIGEIDKFTLINVKADKINLIVRYAKNVIIRQTSLHSLFVFNCEDVTIIDNDVIYFCIDNNKRTITKRNRVDDHFGSKTAQDMLSILICA